MRISDWSSDVCSSDLFLPCAAVEGAGVQGIQGDRAPEPPFRVQTHAHAVMHRQRLADVVVEQAVIRIGQAAVGLEPGRFARSHDRRQARMLGNHEPAAERLVYQAYGGDRSEEHTSELQSLMRISY